MTTFYFRIERVCNATESPSTGLEKMNLVADLKLSKKTCPVNGRYIVAESDGGGSNIIARGLLQRPDQLCTDPCPLCCSRISKISGFAIHDIGPDLFRYEVNINRTPRIRIIREDCVGK